MRLSELTVNLEQYLAARTSTVLFVRTNVRACGCRLDVSGVAKQHQLSDSNRTSLSSFLSFNSTYTPDVLANT